MRAVYQSTQKYLSLSHYEVNSFAPAMSEGYYDKRGKYIPPRVVGSCVVIPCTLEHKNYTFMEGEEHNRLTLTEPIEILNMRAYIKRRGKNDTLLREILFEGDEAELEVKESVEAIEQEEPVKKAPVEYSGIDYEELSDWDKRILSNMVRR